MKYLKSYNESITQYLKPKSKDDIINSLNNLNDKDTNHIRQVLFQFCSEKFKKDIDFYNFLIDESIINKFILKLRSFRLYGILVDYSSMLDLLKILNKKELIKLTNKIIEQ